MEEKNRQTPLGMTDPEKSADGDIGAPGAALHARAKRPPEKRGGRYRGNGKDAGHFARNHDMKMGGVE